MKGFKRIPLYVDLPKGIDYFTLRNHAVREVMNVVEMPDLESVVSFKTSTFPLAVGSHSVQSY